MLSVSFAPDRLRALQERYRDRQPALSLGTVRDFCDSMDHLPELATIQNDLKDLQRPWVFKAILGHIPPGGRILEIGAGEPHVAHLLSQLGYEVWIVDPYDGSGNGPTEFEAFCARYPKLKIIRRQFGTALAEIPAAAFDCVYSISVLEHIPLDPLADVLVMAARCLKPEGWHIHAVDHVFLGNASAYHLKMLESVCAGTGTAVEDLRFLLNRVNGDPDVYLLSAEAHNRWRGATPYDQFPMRRGLSVHFAQPATSAALAALEQRSHENTPAPHLNITPPASRIECHVDRLTTDGLEGWAWSPDGIDFIAVLRDGVEVGRAKPGIIRRPDVRASLGNRPADDCLGFSLLFPRLGAAPAGTHATNHRILLRLHATGGAVTEYNVIDIPRALPDTACRTEPLLLPFPAFVADLLRREAPAGSLHPTNEAALEASVDLLIYLAKHGPTEWRPLRQYLLYLKTVVTRFDALKTMFPVWNLLSEAGRKDFNASATSADEMLPIAHHLYVLQSHGLTGDLCEFGCFKGCSTSMLSFACKQLGLTMQVFDSFEGLPPSESGYYRAAEFRGGLDEVKANVATFGCLDVVRFHRGFFNQTLPTVQVHPLLIWMDVDLESSATDVMTILPKLPKASAVFSHECPAHCFQDGRIDQQRNPDSVLPPIVQAFEADGRNATGRHLFDCTGVVWDAKAGLPVLPPRLIRRLAGSA